MTCVITALRRSAYTLPTVFFRVIRYVITAVHSTCSHRLLWDGSGVFGLGSARRYAATLGYGPGWLGESLIFLGSAIWLALALIYLCRCLIDPRAVRDEFRNNTQFSFISLLPAGGVLVSIGLHPYSLPLANGLMVAGSVGQLIFSARRCAPLWRGEFASEATTPGFYLPTVAANFICAMAFGTAGHPDIGMMFLGAGLISWLTLEPAIIHRLRTKAALPAAARGVIGIQLAPAFVACYAWLCVNGNDFDTFALILLGYGLLQLFLCSGWCVGFLPVASARACGLSRSAYRRWRTRRCGCCRASAGQICKCWHGGCSRWLTCCSSA